MVKVSFLETPINWSDITVDVADLTNPSSRLSVDRQFVDTSISLIDIDHKITRSIMASASIVVGQISFENLDREDWSFGFAQALKARETIVEYAGTRTNTGSVVINAIDARDDDQVFTDSDPAGPMDNRPWTKLKADRFKYFRSRGIIELETRDAPGMRVPAVIGNGASHADNFLRRVSDKREICCVLAVEDRRLFSEPQVLGHSLWTFDLSFTFRWRGKGQQLLAQFIGSVATGQFKEGLPADNGYRKMFDKSFVNGDTFNARATELLTRNIRALKSDRKEESETRFLSVPADFFL